MINEDLAKLVSGIVTPSDMLGDLGYMRSVVTQVDEQQAIDETSQADYGQTKFDTAIESVVDAYVTTYGEVARPLNEVVYLSRVIHSLSVSFPIKDLNQFVIGADAIAFKFAAQVAAVTIPGVTMFNRNSSIVFGTTSFISNPEKIVDYVRRVSPWLRSLVLAFDWMLDVSPKQRTSGTKAFNEAFSKLKKKLVSSNVRDYHGFRNMWANKSGYYTVHIMGMDYLHVVDSKIRIRTASNDGGDIKKEVVQVLSLPMMVLNDYFSVRHTSVSAECFSDLEDGGYTVYYNTGKAGGTMIPEKLINKIMDTYETLREEGSLASRVPPEYARSLRKPNTIDEAIETFVLECVELQGTSISYFMDLSSDNAIEWLVTLGFTNGLSSRMPLVARTRRMKVLDGLLHRSTIIERNDPSTLILM